MRVLAKPVGSMLALFALVAAAPTHAQISFRGAASATGSRSAPSEATKTANFSVNKPAGTAANDVLIASIAVRPSTAAIAPPAGWTLVRRLNNPNSSSNSLAVFYKLALASEPANYTWAISGASFTAGGVQTFGGVDPATPIAAESGDITPLGTTHAAPPITTPVANAMVVSTHALASSGTWEPPIGMTESFDRRSKGGSDGISIEGNWALQTLAGSTGVKAAIARGKADVGNAHILALRPANGPPIVSLISPADGSTFSAASSIPLTANASDQDGTIQKVEFFHGGTNLIGTATSAPYTFSWIAGVPGSYTITAVATDNQNATTTSAPVNVTVINTAPTISLTSPASGATFNAPANILITAEALDSEGAIQKVEFFHGGTNLIVSLTSPPYSITWTSVPAGAYSLTAVATDNQNVSTTSAPVSVTVNRESALHFVHVDHLSTPRLVSDASGTTVWKWDQQEPFGANTADENPGGLTKFDVQLRLPGQYFDKETNLHYNYFRDYDPGIGRYAESDPIGLRAGTNTYLYVSARPLTARDPKGLQQISSPEESSNTNPGQGAFEPGVCGSGWNEPLVWDNPFGFPFSPCCINHDRCYGDCIRKPTRAQCDTGFCMCVAGVCTRYPVGIKQLCTSTAGLYCSQVTANGAPYFAAARAACPRCR